jgi:uncharacterized membrane protein
VIRVPRTLAKTATYCLMHLTVAMAVAFALTGSWRAALAIGIIEPFVQTFAFSLHERLWCGRDAGSAAAGCSHVNLFGKGAAAEPAAAES